LIYKFCQVIIINFYKNMRKAITLSLLGLILFQPLLVLAGTDYLFTGQEYNRDLDLYYYQQRNYDQNLGRFLEPDPVVNNLHDQGRLRKQTGQTQEQILSSPQNLNNYSYTKNNPANYIDPNGEFNWKTGEVEKGDSLSEVFGDRWREVAEYNNLENPNLIHPGQILKVPFAKDQSFFEQGADWGSALIPGVSDLRDVAELIYGKDLATKEKFNFFERIELVGLSLVPVISASMMKKAQKFSREFLDKAVQKIMDQALIRKIGEKTGFDLSKTLRKLDLPVKIDNFIDKYWSKLPF